MREGLDVTLQIAQFDSISMHLAFHRCGNQHKSAENISFSLGAIYNCQLYTKCTNILFQGEWGVNEKKNIDSVHFQHVSQFSWQIIHLKNVDVYTFWWEGGVSEKVYVLYTHLNVDNNGRPLIIISPEYFLNNYITNIWSYALG